MTLDAVPKPRRLSTCHRHPAEPVTGVCALCLGERLTYLDSPGDPLPTSSASITAFAPAPEPSVPASSAAVAGAKPTSRRTRFPPPAYSSKPPELSRSKSYSAAKCGANLGLSEPRRKSCDVRVRSSLCQLFDLDGGGEGDTRRNSIESKNLGFTRATTTILESRGEDENADQIRVSGDSIRPNVYQYLQRLEDVEEAEDVKTMKEHIELEWQRMKHAEKNLKDIAGNIWVAASAFSQKLKKWKMKKRRGGGGGSQNFDGRRRFPPGEKPNGGTMRETQSEVGEYGCYGRRSCDIEPRFSVDAGRMSLDDPRYSLDEPRASWDGYMVARTIPCLAPIISVTENVRIPPINRSDYGISIEEKMSSIMEDPMTSGGSAQTRDYGSDSSSSQRRNSFDGSSSGMSSSKKTVAVEVDEMKTILNSKVSHTGAVYQSVKFVVKDRECRDLDFVDHKFDKDDVVAVNGGFKKSGRWKKAWNILGFKHRPRSNQCLEPARHSISEPPVESRGSGVSNGKLIRSGSSGSGRMIGSYRRSLSVAECRGNSKKNKEESVLDRNRSARQLPSNLENGLLRLYLTPLWNFRGKSGKNRLKNSHSVARGALPAN